MDKWHSIADEKIREAMKAGHFRALRGEGRPLKLERNPFEPPELHMAHLVLEGAGMSPAWIEERKALDEAVEQERAKLSRARGTSAWPAAASAFRAAAVILNRRILTYNLSVPAGGFQRLQIDADFEIQRLGQAPEG